MDLFHAKFRCNRAMVKCVINTSTGKEMDHDYSIYDNNFIYKKNKIIICNNYNTHINIVCTSGIHYFKTKETALSWFFQQQDMKHPDGKWTSWFENGNKYCEGSYKNDKKNGKWTSWYDNGHKHYEGSYKNGNENGKWTYWYCSGSKRCCEFYKDGEIYKRNNWY